MHDRGHAPAASKVIALRSVKISQTIERLQARIEERFPQRGLARLCGELFALSVRTAKLAAQIDQPNWWLRGISFGILILGAAGLYQLQAYSSRLTLDKVDVLNFVQVLEAAFNLFILCSLGILFLVTLEKRYKRSRALKGLHELRSISHVIDMYQLTKDPDVVLEPLPPTRSSPEKDLSPAELVRYLDYCSEMLSLAGKLAALYAQYLHDPVVINAVNDIETLTSGLSRKIWQKLIVLQNHADSLDRIRTQMPAA